MIKLVCFDVGGVLIRITQRWHEAAQYAGVPIRADFDPATVLTDVPFFNAYQSGELAEEAYFQSLADYLGTQTADEARAVHNHIMIEPYPGVDALVRDLTETGLATACLSNTNAPHWEEMNNSGRFPANEALWFRMASHEVRLQKPDEEIFRLFEREAGFSGGEIAFFDDSRENVTVAQRLGWNAKALDPSADTDKQMREHLNTLGVVPSAVK